MISETKSDYKKSKTSIGWKTKRGDFYLLCPFHSEKTPSCLVNTRKYKNFICYGCGRCGGMRELTKKLGVDRRYFDGMIAQKYALENHYLPWYYTFNQVPTPASPDSETADP